MLMPKNVGDLIKECLETDTYEVHQKTLVEQYVKPHHRVLEAGAGLGFITRLISERAQFVVSCEANEELYRCAEENAPEAIVIQRVLSGKNLTGPYESAHTGDAFGVGDVSRAIPIDADTLIDAYHLNALVLDVEGEEADIIKRSKRLDALELVIVEWHPLMCGSIPMTQAHKRLLDQGFEECHTIYDGRLVHAAYVRW